MTPARKVFPPPGYKNCSRCQVVKNKASFHVNRSKKDGLQDWCTKCVAVTQNERRKHERMLNREEI